MNPKLAAAVVFVAFALFLAWGFNAKGGAESPPPPPPPRAAGFEIVSGPDRIGRDDFYVLREKTTGAVFVYTTRSSGGGFLMPLPR